jgi:hypothetical protein
LCVLGKVKAMAHKVNKRRGQVLGAELHLPLVLIGHIYFLDAHLINANNSHSNDYLEFLISVVRVLRHRIHSTLTHIRKPVKLQLKHTFAIHINPLETR